jgi:DNA repair protein RadC
VSHPTPILAFVLLLQKNERPRERLLRLGPSALADHELLATLLRDGGQHQNVIDLAMSLTASVGSLADLATADVHQISAVAGVGPAKSASIVAAFELGRRALEPPVLPILTDNDAIAKCVRPLLVGIDHERSVLLVADHGLRVKRRIVLSEGGGNAVLIDKRDVLNIVLRNNGHAFALAHNHPSGRLSPSPADIVLTHDITAAATATGLRFLDHLIVTTDGWQSINANALH